MNKLLPILTLLVVTTGAGAQGTIEIINTGATRFNIHGARLPGSIVAGRFRFGVFVGLTPDNLSSQPVLPLATNTSGGLIIAPNPQAYQIPDFDPGETVFIQIRGWETRFGTDWQRGRDEGLFGQTAIRPFVLGPASGPGAVIWARDTSDLEKLQAINLVPEPSTIVFAVLGLVWLFRFRASSARQGRARPGVNERGL